MFPSGCFVKLMTKKEMFHKQKIECKRKISQPNGKYKSNDIPYNFSQSNGEKSSPNLNIWKSFDSEQNFKNTCIMFRKMFPMNLCT